MADLSSLLSQGIQLYDTQAVGGPKPYVNNQVPIVSSVAKYLFAHPELYPLPNTPGGGPLGLNNNFTGPSRSFTKNDQGDAKVDWHFRGSDVITFRYSQGYAQDGTITNLLPVTFPSASSYPDHLFNTNWIHTYLAFDRKLVCCQLRPHPLQQRFEHRSQWCFRAEWQQHRRHPERCAADGRFQPPEHRHRRKSQYQRSPNPSSIGISSVGTNPTPEIFIDNMFGYSDNLTWQRGRHLLKFGAQFIRYQQNSFYPGNNGELGSFNYGGEYTALPGTTTYGYADFLQDRADDAAIGAVTGRTGQRQWRDAFFAQDDWKLLPNLTINLGLRWEYSQPIYEVNNKEANIDIPTMTVIYAGQNGNSRALYDPTYNQWQPRVGFAYSPTPRTVVRGGYGISSYLEGTGANLRLTQNPPFHTDFEAKGVAPNGSGATYSPGVVLHSANGFPTAQVPTTTFYVWPKNMKPAVVQEFSLTTEYQVSKSSSVQLGYVGVVGHHLTNPFYGNQQTSPTAAGPFDSIVGAGGVVKITQTEAASSYNGLQAVYRLRPTAGLELTANYTYSKSMSNNIGFYGVSNNNSNQYYNQDSYNPHAEWSPAGTDTRQNISVTGVYALPFGQGKQFGSHWNTAVNTLLGGWKLSGAQVFYTGFPVTMNSPARYSSQVGAFTGSARPSQFQAFHPTNRGINAYYGNIGFAPNAAGADFTVCDAGCTFSQQPTDGFGNVRPGTLRAPSFQNIDMALAKSFTVWHEHSLNFRADAFNAFNIASYSQPDSNVADTTFGQINNTVSNSRNIQLSLKYAF